MRTDFLRRVKAILLDAFEKSDDFYRVVYHAAGIDKKDIAQLTQKSFSSLPVVTLKDLANAPYKQRCIKEDRGFNKLVFSNDADRYFLVHRTLEEIREDYVPYEGSRPLVLMQNVYEALERCLFFYEHRVLPLIGEVLNPAVVYATAKQYRVDSVVIDHGSVTKFREGLLSLKLPLKSVNVVDSTFSSSDLAWTKKLQIHYTISLPEFGLIGNICPQSTGQRNPVLHPYEDVYIEPSARSILTSARLRSCPMIRYQSNLDLKDIESKCLCEEQYSFAFSQKSSSAGD